MVAWLSGAPRRIGFGDAKGRELSRWLNTELVDTTAAARHRPQPPIAAAAGDR